jgi:hypothetical protein
MITLFEAGQHDAKVVSAPDKPGTSKLPGTETAEPLGAPPDPETLPAATGRTERAPPRRQTEPLPPRASVVQVTSAEGDAKTGPPALCAQCGAPGDDHGPVTEHKIGRERVPLHSVCHKFYVKRRQNGENYAGLTEAAREAKAVDPGGGTKFGGQPHAPEH